MFKNPFSCFSYCFFVVFCFIAFPASSQTVYPTCTGGGTAGSGGGCWSQANLDSYQAQCQSPNVFAFYSDSGTCRPSTLLSGNWVCHVGAQCTCPSGYSLVDRQCVETPPAECLFPDAINPVTGQCDYCPSGNFDASGICLDCPGGDCESSSSSSSSSTPICVPPYYYDPIVDDCVLDDSSSSSNGSSSSTGDSGSSASSAGSSSSDGGSGSSSPGTPVPSDSTCPNKFQIGDQWYCQSNPMPSSDGQASSDSANAAVSGSCDSAPVCDGDPVGCAILLNAFFDRCNTDKTTEGGGDCSAEPSCSGDPVGCSIALQSWKLRCDQNGDPIDADADVTEYGDNFDSEFGEDNQASVDDEGALSHLSEVSNVVDFSSVDMSGLDIDSTGRSSQCPAPRPISLSVGSYEMSYQPLCDLAESLSSLVVLIFSYISIRLIWRSTQNGG